MCSGQWTPERLVRLLIVSLREGKDVVDEVLLLEDERRLLMRRQNYQQFCKGLRAVLSF